MPVLVKEVAIIHIFLPYICLVRLQVPLVWPHMMGIHSSEL